MMIPFAGAGDPAGPAPAGRRRRIGEVLVEQGVINGDQLSELLHAQTEIADPVRRRLGRLVVDRGLASERQVAQALADALGMPLVDLARTMVEPDVARSLPRNVAERHAALPLTRGVGGALRVATSDPTNVVGLDDIRLYTRTQELIIVVAQESQLRQKLNAIWSIAEDAEDVVTLLDDDEEPVSDGPEITADAEDAPIVRLVDVLLADAVRKRASDIHIEPQSDDVSVRFRVDGLLREMMTLPRSSAPAIASRFKIISSLDIAERRRPQDGRARLSIDGTTVDARVSTLPALHGEKVVIRLLARSSDVLPLTACGFEPDQLAHLERAISAPQGLVLITGPTGSGKTSTLYSAIRRIHEPDINIVTLEDPVEIAVPGVVQVQINEKAGLTFARGLRSVLRQDPDVVLVGEVRDTETAELALQSSLTGHLVLTTLHTNDAVSAVTRMVDMGVQPFLIASSLTLVVAQRLMRRPCRDCAKPVDADPRILDLLGLVAADLVGATLVRGSGCETCGGTGYSGRLAVQEVLPVTAAMRSVLLSGADERAVAKTAKAEGMQSMRSVGVAKALRGETTLEEVLRVTQADTREGSVRCAGCARTISDEMTCCPWCGTRSGKQTCGTCKQSLELGWEFCPWCQTPVERQVARVAAPLPVRAA